MTVYVLGFKKTYLKPYYLQTKRIINEEKKLFFLGGQVCENPNTKILKEKKVVFGKIEVVSTWCGYYNDSEGQLTYCYPQI